MLKPNAILPNTYQLLAGCCNDEYSKYVSERQKLDHEAGNGKIDWGKGAFDQNLFVNWGDGCLGLRRPGKYTITAEIENDHVIVSADPCVSKLKTATGKLKSTALIITVTE
ncbi:MAG TPA: hypothetical protein VFC63_23780 [Blastocatellia bacterium]|nr:hypothetical protein [Blastocatellia bacterium]